MPSLTGDDSGTGFGVHGRSVAGPGLLGESASGAGAAGHSDTGPGVTGDSQSGAGVVGVSRLGPGTTGKSDDDAGVVGVSRRGPGVTGSSDEAVGVSGESRLDNGVLGQTAAGGRAGVFGRNTAPDGGNGVVGLAEGLGGTGVFGQGGPRGQGVIANGATGLVAIGDAGPGTESSSRQQHGVVGRAERKTFAGVLGVHAGPEPGPGVRGETQGSDSTGVEGQGHFGVVGIGSYFGVVGRRGSPPPAGWAKPFVAGVLGQTNDGTPAVRGVANGPFAVGVTGEVTDAGSTGVSGTGDVGVLGRTNGVSSLISAGVRGESNAQNVPAVMGMSTSTGPGVWGIAQSGNAILGMGGSFGTGVVGINVNHPGGNVGPFGFAGRFEGAVNVTGAVHKSGGGFRIDHPLEPETKYLDHAFVESDERKNVYDGVAELGGDGTADIALPAWFEELNEAFRYQLTPLGGPAPELHVRREIAGGRFEIAGGRPGQRVCWQVTGRRRDAWARANPMAADVEKAEVERGRYRHPEAYGLPRERGVGFALYGEAIEAAERGPARPSG